MLIPRRPSRCSVPSSFYTSCEDWWSAVNYDRLFYTKYQYLWLFNLKFKTLYISSLVCFQSRFPLLCQTCCLIQSLLDRPWCTDQRHTSVMTAGTTHLGSSAVLLKNLLLSMPLSDPQQETAVCQGCHACSVACLRSACFM